MAYKTLEWYESAWSGLFDYAINNEFTLTRNHAKGLKKGLEKDSAPKLPFTQQQLQAIFEGPNFQSRTDDDPAKYWVPTILLYTGARLNEICQLLVDDIIEEEGVKCIRINDDEATRQRLKNEASRRFVPIHSKLIELGFLSYVDARRQRGDQKLFPSLDDGSVKHNKYFGNWINRYFDVVGVVGKGLDSHSFRHTVILAFKTAEVPETHAAAICGHEHGERDDNGDKKKDSTYSMYGGQIPPDKLVKYVELLDWNIKHSSFSGELDASRRGVRKISSVRSR
ncbi:site-specific integrase [Azonexus hydrophilus]|uniref:Site-specific integrase n=1 Tax=Azonexus hydrophilus TaxID=418702 RepID=A0ABZ2XDA5_9RHOO